MVEEEIILQKTKYRKCSNNDGTCENECHGIIVDSYQQRLPQLWIYHVKCRQMSLGKTHRPILRRNSSKIMHTAAIWIASRRPPVWNEWMVISWHFWPFIQYPRYLLCRMLHSLLFVPNCGFRLNWCPPNCYLQFGWRLSMLPKSLQSSMDCRHRRMYAKWEFERLQRLIDALALPHTKWGGWRKYVN